MVDAASNPPTASLEKAGSHENRNHRGEREHRVADTRRGPWTRRRGFHAERRSGAAAKGAPWRDLDVFDLDALRAVVASVDFVVSAYHPGNSARDIGDALQRAIADPTVYARVAKNLVKALERRAATRAIVVGGAANRDIAPGLTTDDDDGYARCSGASEFRKPTRRQPRAIAMRSTFCACRTGPGPT
jgi:hypothetical protein